MLLTLYVEFIVTMSWIFVSNVYSQSTDCGYVPEHLQNTNAEGAWPWMVAITRKERSGNYSSWCNGFLIDRRHVLTAAHCFDSTDISEFLARIGKKNWNDGEVYEIAFVTKHPRYKSGFYYGDIAIVTLSRNVDTPNSTPICLPANLRMKTLNGAEVTKAAWGAVKRNGVISRTLIQTAGLRIISNRDCSNAFRSLLSKLFNRHFPDGLSSDMICAENPTNQEESCVGDSGAPLMYRDENNNWIAVGISIFGYACATAAPVGYTRISTYLEWIIENTGDVHDCGYVPKVLQDANSDGAWPWMVAIIERERGGKYNLLCNGFLIDRRHALTTAHCFGAEYNVSNFLTRIGKKNWSEGEVYEIACVTRHPRYEMGLYYDDIAIVTLSRNVDTPYYKPICLPDDDLRVKSLSGVEVTKVAWGATKIGGIISETLKQNAGLRIIPNKDCDKTFRKLVGAFSRVFPGGVSGDMVCTENPTGQTETCGGDGGAPIMYKDNSSKWIAVGISVFGYSCGLGVPNGLTRVSAYLEWIIENTGDNKVNCS